jgi:hypothetical protein
MKLQVEQFTINGCSKDMFETFFAIDEDFKTNEEYFRKDTLALGYKNEAERCSEELYNKYFPDGEHDGYWETLADALDEGASYSIDGHQFILGNQSYTRQFIITLNCLDDHHNEYDVIISYILI